MRNARQAPWALIALTALVTLFMAAPIALSVMAGLVHNYGTGLRSGPHAALAGRGVGALREHRDLVAVARTAVRGGQPADRRTLRLCAGA